MKLFLIRHGETDWNLEGRIQGSYDSELNDTGIRQAEELSKKILESNYTFSRIYSSPQKRALKTAQILSQAISVNCISIKGLEEIKLGEWEGLSWKQVREKFPLEYDRWYKNRRYEIPPGGESYQHMLERVLETIRKIIEENYEAVAIVTHSAVIMCLQCYLTDTPFHQMNKFKADNTSVLEIDSEAFTGK